MASSIIDLQQYQQQQTQLKNMKPLSNGLVDIVHDPKLQFQMYEASVRENKSSNYYEALTGFWEDSTLSRCFFSAENMQIIQNALRAGVYHASQQTIVIAPQSNVHLKIIMRTLYMEHARHVTTNITEQIELLNQKVLDYCIPYVYKEAVFYLKYLQDSSTLPVPLEHSRQVDRDFKQLHFQSYL